MEIRHTIRFQEMERINRGGGNVITLLRAQGMVLTDECRPVPPSTLTFRDNINGAGTRTFIWDDGFNQSVSTEQSFRTYSMSGMNLSGWGGGVSYSGRQDIYGARVFNGSYDEAGQPKLEEVKIEPVQRTRQVRTSD